MPNLGELALRAVLARRCARISIARSPLSATVLKVHQDRTYCGAAVASLSVPWGDSSQSRGGYHLVWPRDLVETAGALVALGAYDEARDTLRYLLATQQEDGHWFQNQWLGGAAFWQGVQLDETAFPILLASALQASDQLEGHSGRRCDQARGALSSRARAFRPSMIAGRRMPGSTCSRLSSRSRGWLKPAHFSKARPRTLR